VELGLATAVRRAGSITEEERAVAVTASTFVNGSITITIPNTTPSPTTRPSGASYIPTKQVNPSVGPAQHGISQLQAIYAADRGPWNYM
jgi:hypothetical protein